MKTTTIYNRISIKTATILLAVAIFGLLISTAPKQSVAPVVQSVNTLGIGGKGVELSVFTDVAKASSSDCLLSLTVTSQYKSIAQGGSNVYSIMVKNTGDSKCQNVLLTNYYSDNMTVVAANPKPTSSSYYWNIGKLAPGAVYQVNFTINHLANISGENIEIESCATAEGQEDACRTSILNIGSTQIAATSPLAKILQAVVPTSVEQVSSPRLQGKEYGSWVWTAPVDMTEEFKKSVLDTASSNGINVLYVTVDDYLNIHNMPDGEEKNIKKKAFSDSLESFIKEAKEKGIAVDAEAGWRDWAEASQKWKATVIVDYVKEYNSTHTYKLRGFQYDVEPYLLPSYNKTSNRALLLKNFVQLVDETVTKLQGSDLAFTVVIPHFYDDAQKWTPSFTYGGNTTYTFNHLLNILDKRSNSNIILMSYRNFASGEDGTIDISQIEIQEASAMKAKTKIIVAQETGEVDPDYATFYGTSKAEYLKQISLVNSMFNSYSNFGGMAVHHIETIKVLR